VGCDHLRDAAVEEVDEVEAGKGWKERVEMLRLGMSSAVVPQELLPYKAVVTGWVKLSHSGLHCRMQAPNTASIFTYLVKTRDGALAVAHLFFWKVLTS